MYVDSFLCIGEIMDIKILVAAHKTCCLPDDPMYAPIFVGAAGKDPIDGIALRDDKGDNISEKNPYYCELTGHYFAWKNLSADAVGLVHYRRYLSVAPWIVRFFSSDRMGLILNHDQAEKLLSKYDAIVPMRRNYIIESLYSHYLHTIGEDHLALARAIIAKDKPEYIPFVDEAYTNTWGFMFNMMILKKEYYDDYMSFLFPVLFELEKDIDTDKLSDFHKRLFGRVSEVLFNAWVLKKRREGMRVKEIAYMPLDRENWIKKGSAFLSAKFLGKKYEESF